MARWPDRINGFPLADDVSLGGEGLGLDSIEIVELLLDCEERVGAANDPDALFEAGDINVGRLIDHLARG
jgi:acyl carrier protein